MSGRIIIDSFSFLENNQKHVMRDILCQMNDYYIKIHKFHQSIRTLLDLLLILVCSIILVKFEINLKMYTEITIYLVQVDIYLAEITKVFWQSVIHSMLYTNFFIKCLFAVINWLFLYTFKCFYQPVYFSQFYVNVYMRNHKDSSKKISFLSSMREWSLSD